MVSVYDALRYKTYIMFIYKSMKWDYKITKRKSSIGYLFMNSGISHDFNNAKSMTKQSFRIDKSIGNIG